MPVGVSAPQGAVGRADLLRALAAAPRDRLALDIDASGWFGYMRLPVPAVAGDIVGMVEQLRPAVSRKGVAPRKLPLRLPFIHAVVERHQREDTPDAQAQAELRTATPLDEARLQAPSPMRLVSYEDLVPQARLLPALRRLLGATRAGALDIERLSKRLAERDLPRYLPRQTVRRWHPALVVLLDFSSRLWPYREDMHRLAESLLRYCGRAGVSLRIINHGPPGRWSDWLDHQNRQARGAPLEKVWVNPAVGAPVLIVSDLGLLQGVQSAAGKAWLRFIAGLSRSGRKPLALVPLGGGQLDASVTQALPVLRWSPDARTRPARAHGPAQPAPPGLDDLLAMVAATRRVDPPLLRAMRHLNPQAPLNAGLEGALWCHADVEAGSAATVRLAAREAHLSRFGSLLPSLQIALGALRQRHHAHLRAVLNHEEMWLWWNHIHPLAAHETTMVRKQVDEAEEFFRSLAATLMHPGGERSAAQWWEVAQGIVERADAAMRLRHADLLTLLVAARMRWDRARGAAPVAPDWIDPARLSPLLADDQPPVQCWLVRDAASGNVVLQTSPAGDRQSPLGAALALDAGGMHVEVGEAAGARTRWRSAGDLPVPLVRLDQPTRFRIETAREAVVVAPLLRPRGTASWSCDASGISIQSATLAGFNIHWKPDATPKLMLHGEVVEDSGMPGHLRFGLDAEFMVWADLMLTTRHGSATQRFRWIEPGTFWMGSPEDEAERDSDEGPRHLATLTQGYWLADTACTQAMWEAVMGSNPSNFKGDPLRPVEQVSWNDVQDFLRKLEQLVPGCGAGLPTEAQWEYACRAGSETPFSFGVQITPGQVNYDGNHPYAGGEKGEYREQTVAVKSFPANAWGLYEMHGNVWEWCADGKRDYDEEPRRDPEGPGAEDKKALRALRGGSWYGSAGRARSADRDADPPGLAILGLGFRLCLRSIEPGQAKPGPGGHDRVSPAARDAPWLGRAGRALGFLGDRPPAGKKKR